jgi:single-strand DNA-binding protein
MASLNKVMLIGNVGKDPEMRFVPSGSPVTSFSIATNRVYTTSDGEKKQETDWFNVTAWRKLAEYCNQYITKGRRVYVEGSLRNRTWEGKDGQKRYSVEIIADRVFSLDKQTAVLPTDDTTPDVAGEDIEPEDIPFNKEA